MAASGAALAIQISATGTQQASQGLNQVSHAVQGVGTASQGTTGHLTHMAEAAGGFAIGEALAELPSKLMEFAHSAAEGELSITRMQTALHNVGGDFDENLAKVNEAVESGQHLAFSADDVRDSFDKLVVATGDTDEALARQKLAMDLARGAGIDLGMASKLMGKVTDETASAFQRLGIHIDKGTSAADQMAIIQKKFGGQADSYAKSTAGQFEQASLAMEEIERSIGTVVLPLMTKLSQVISDNLPLIQGLVEGFGKLAGSAIGGLVDMISPVIDKISGLGQVVVGFFEDLGGLENTDSLQLGLEKLFGIDSDLIGPIMEALHGVSEAIKQFISGDFGGAFDTLGGVVANMAPILGTALASWSQQFVDWVVPAAAVLVTELVKIDTAVVTWIQDEAPKIAAQILAWAAAFVDWVGTTAVPTLQQELPKIEAALTTFLVNEEGPLATKVIQAFTGFWTWVATDAVPQLQLELPKIGDKLADWLLNTAIPWAATNMPTLGEALIDGIAAGLSGAWVSKLMPWLKGLVSGDGSGGGPDAASILAVLNAANPLTLLSSFGGALISGLLKGLVDHWEGSATAAGAKDFFVTLPGKVVTMLENGIRGVADQISAAGGSIIASLASGMTSKLADLQSTVSGLVNAIPSWIRDLLGIHSPSDVMFGLGANITEGLRLGMLSKLGGIEGVVKALTDKALGMMGGMGGSLSGAVSDWLSAAIGITGVSPDWLSGLLRLVSAESGGDPHALNPVAVGNEHAAGLLQTLPSTFAANALPGMGDIWNPIDNAVAAIRYILGRYGSVYNTPLFTSGGTYMGYDAGGYLPVGRSLVVNNTGRPEPVLTPDQLAGLMKKGGGGIHVTINDPHQGTNIRRLVRDALYEIRRQERTSARLGI